MKIVSASAVMFMGGASFWAKAFNSDLVLLFTRSDWNKAEYYHRGKINGQWVSLSCSKRGAAKGGMWGDLRYANDKAKVEDMEVSIHSLVKMRKTLQERVFNKSCKHPDLGKVVLPVFDRYIEEKNPSLIDLNVDLVMNIGAALSDILNLNQSFEIKVVPYYPDPNKSKTERVCDLVQEYAPQGSLYLSGAGAKAYWSTPLQSMPTKFQETDYSALGDLSGDLIINIVSKKPVELRELILGTKLATYY